MRNAGQNHEIAKIFVVLLRSSNKYLGTIFYMAVRTVPVTLVVLILYYDAQMDLLNGKKQSYRNKVNLSYRNHLNNTDFFSALCTNIMNNPN
jgi:uncharacterized membrane protein